MGLPFRWEIKYATIITVSAPLSAGGQPSVPNLEKEGGEVMSAWEGWILKSLCHRYLPGGAYYVSCQKRLFKMKCGFKSSIFKCQSWPALAK